MTDVTKFPSFQLKAKDDGIALTSIEHPTASIRMKDDISPNSLTVSPIEIDDKFIPTLERRLASDKPLCRGDVVKILDIVHVWMGDGFIAVKYGANLVWPVEK